MQNQPTGNTPEQDAVQAAEQRVQAARADVRDVASLLQGALVEDDRLSGRTDGEQR